VSQTVPAVCVGPAVDLERTDCGTVHSVFAHAVNLLVRGDLWTLLAESRGDLPFGIRVGLTNFDALGLFSGDRVSVRVGFVGIGSRLVVDCRAALRWAPACGEGIKPGLKGRLALIANAVCHRSWYGSAEIAHALRYAMRHKTGLGELLANVVGLGPGATPSGDDVLVGVLAVLTSPHSGKAGTTAAAALGKALVPLLPTTTDVSGHLLRQATRGLFSRDLSELIAALLGAPSVQEMGAKTCRILESGVTSGADTCEGLLAFAPSYFERASA
jgi:hypothetical protein